MAKSVLLTTENLSKSFGSQTLFDGLSFSLFEGDRVGLVGPNGAGKSTLLEILSGVQTTDSGSVSIRRGVRVGFVPQDPIFATGQTVAQVVSARLDDQLDLEDHERHHRTAVALGQAGFRDDETRTEILSGGWRKRLAIARELAYEPDILLLDEPTNHLDLQSILWLEGLLMQKSKAFVAVSHDRVFLQRMARRIVELNSSYAGGLLVSDGSYADYLEARERVLDHQASARATLANLVKTEVEWLRRGPKARTTKSKARIETASAMIGELADHDARARSSRASIDFDASGRRSKRLWIGRGLSKEFDGKRLFEGLDLLLTPGDRLGVLGSNGSGKTTLLRLIVGELEPDEGTVQTAPKLRTVYFEQNRAGLDPTSTLRRALAPTGDTVVFRDRPIHVAAWARRFLFRNDQLEAPIETLSGGERARVVLARMMLQPADLLVLDEPTNDLDIPTLDVLEAALSEFPGALVLVTHDRYLLDRVSTRLLALDGSGRATFFADSYQWEAALKTVEKRERRKTKAARESVVVEPKKTKPRRRTYHEQQEWDSMEQRVLDAEAELDRLVIAAEDPEVASDSLALQERVTAVAAARARVDGLYARWAELEELAG